jgi:hypothetical protein
MNTKKYLSAKEQINSLKALQKGLYPPTPGLEMEGGGDLLSSISQLSGMAVGNPMVSGILMAINAANRSSKEDQMYNNQNMERDMNPFMRKGGYMDGGVIPNEFVQFDAPSHEMGGMDISQDGTLGGQDANIEKQENLHKTDKPYVYSDTLKNPFTNNTFAKDAASIAKKYKNADKDNTEKAALQEELKQLRNTNDLMRQTQESIDEVMRCGGPVKKKMALGGDPTKNTFKVDPVPPEDPMGLGSLLNIPQPIGMQKPVSPLPSKSFATPLPTLQKPDLTFAPKSTRTEVDPDVPDPFGRRKADNLQDSQIVAATMDMLEPPALDPLILPDKSRSRAYMDQARIDSTQAKQDAIGQANAALQSARNNTRSSAIGQALSANVYANLQDALGRINMQEQGANSQVNMAKAQAENQMAFQDAQLRVKNIQDNLANIEASRTAKNVLASVLGDMGQRESIRDMRIAIAQNAKELALVSNKELMYLLEIVAPNIKTEMPEIYNELMSEKDKDKRLKLIQQIGN